MTKRTRTLRDRAHEDVGRMISLKFPRKTAEDHKEDYVLEKIWFAGYRAGRRSRK